MSVFVDTSALYALLVSTEERHAAVRAAFERLLRTAEPLETTSYVLVETSALLQHRIGLPAVRDLDDHLVPVLMVNWVDRALHERGMLRLRRENRRKLSFVDCVSLELMRDRGLTTALALDVHFREAGHRLVPAQK